MKKLFSILLVAAMLCAMLPQTVLFASAETYSGWCGDNVRWTLDTSTGTLSISGSGEMSNWHYEDIAPWFVNAYSWEYIQTVQIGNDVTSIGDGAFEYCTNITSVTIGDSVKRIGVYAFSYCISLKNVTIPSSVTKIGEAAFDECYSLESVTIPESVKSIGNFAFGDCSSLSSIYIYNPNCVFYDNGDTGIGVMKQTTIYGYAGSTAYNYAKKYGIKFTSIGKMPNNPSCQFDDVKTSSWYYDAVKFAVTNNLFNGVGNNKFAPNTAMSRAMLVTVLWRYEGCPTGYSNSFKDVKNSAWYADAVSWASAQGIVNGVENGKFNPDGKVTREQLATILYRYAEYFDKYLYGDTFLAPFVDTKKVSSWAMNAVRWAVSEGLINGVSNNKSLYLDPAGNASRAQVAAILMRFITDSGVPTDTRFNYGDYFQSGSNFKSGPGYGLTLIDVYPNYDGSGEGTAIFEVFFWGKNASPYDESERIYATINEYGEGTFRWSDSWGNSGTGNITVHCSRVIRLKMVVTHKASGARATLATNGEVILYYDG